ncbi:unnamed protein product [Didymodactylos carnosus]|uniref:Centrosomal protein of 70 kDa n=1 Tax=Didymodactylos carnosus TaxID=1234261 RepID=A0A814HAD0_9BILA|nr:unnamed protein product [Didymodactylos carnosus]CAF1249894.1 unnamed protein product [Didymodactylos carnosus]CAF3779230.1 unnamed protein product [Didymodactylos carnosus]CAF4057493.1 unnamed protein product [Didymodactylos carnosus]
MSKHDNNNHEKSSINHTHQTKKLKSTLVNSKKQNNRNYVNGDTPTTVNDDEDDTDDQTTKVQTLDETNEADRTLDISYNNNNTNTNHGMLMADNSNNKHMIHELLQSNMNLKHEIRDIRRQIRKSDKQTKLHTPKVQLDNCQDTIAQLRKTIDIMEKRLEQLRTLEQNGNSKYLTMNNDSQTTTDHRFIHELFHMCIKYNRQSSSSKHYTNNNEKQTKPSHYDMRNYIWQTFSDTFKDKSNQKRIQQIYKDHHPSYQFCLRIIEQCQSLFDSNCFTQIPTTLNELYYKQGELNNFKKSIASALGVDSSKTSCPKLIKILQTNLDDCNSNEFYTFKKLTKISDLNEAATKIRAYDDFVPYYHKFIEQISNQLEVSKGEEIIPAIKTLKLLAHTQKDDDLHLYSNGNDNRLLLLTNQEDENDSDNKKSDNSTIENIKKNYNELTTRKSSASSTRIPIYRTTSMNISRSSLTFDKNRTNNDQTLTLSSSKRETKRPLGSSSSLRLLSETKKHIEDETLNNKEQEENS